MIAAARCLKDSHSVVGMGCLAHAANLIGDVMGFYDSTVQQNKALVSFFADVRYARSKYVNRM